LSPPTLLELDSPATARFAGFFPCTDVGTGGALIGLPDWAQRCAKGQKLFIEHGDKIDIARILIERIDGAVAQARVSTLALANAVLERWAKDAPENGEGQCQIQIIFEDGVQYQSHIGLSRSQKRISLAKLLRQQLSAMAAPKTGQRKTKDVAGLISNIDIALPTIPLNAEIMLARYDI